MTVYVDYTDYASSSATDIVWSRLWADTPAEAREFATRLGITWHGSTRTVISEPRRRRAILMGAIPARTPHRPVAGADVVGVAA